MHGVCEREAARDEKQFLMLFARILLPFHHHPLPMLYLSFFLPLLSSSRLFSSLRCKGKSVSAVGWGLDSLLLRSGLGLRFRLPILCLLDIVYS